MWRSFTQQYFLIYFHFLFNFCTEGRKILEAAVTNQNLGTGAVDVKPRIAMEKKRNGRSKRKQLEEFKEHFNRPTRIEDNV